MKTFLLFDPCIKILTLYSFLFFSANAQQITFEKKYDYSFHAEGGSDLVQTSDDGYMIAGTQGIAINYINLLTMKTDSMGIEQWHTFTGSGNEWVQIRIAQLNDTVFYTAGNSNAFTGNPADRDFLLIKMDNNGDTIWTKNYGSNQNESMFDFKATSDNGLILAGTSAISGQPAFFVKTNLNGDTLWTRTWVGPYSGANNYAIIQTSDGGYLSTGATLYPNPVDSNHYETMFLLKMDSMGIVQWSKFFPHDTVGSTNGYDILQLPDSGYIVIGNKSTYNPQTFLYDWDNYLVRTNSAGDTIWTSVTGGLNSDYFKQGVLTGSNEFVVTGTTLNNPNAPNGDILIQKFSVNSPLVWSRTYGDSSDDQSYNIIQTSDQGYAIIGYSFGTCPGCVYLIKTDSFGCVVPGCQLSIIEEPGNKETEFNIYPNPADDQLTVFCKQTLAADLEIDFTDAFGRQVNLPGKNSAFNGNNSITFNVNNVTPGLYFLKIENKKTRKYFLKKIVIN